MEADLTDDHQLNEIILQPQHLAVAAFYLRFQYQKVEIVGGREVSMGGRTKRGQPHQQAGSSVRRPLPTDVRGIGK